MQAFAHLSRPFRHAPIITASWRTISTAPKHPLRMHDAVKGLRNRRNKTKDTGDNKSGHIDAGQNEGIFFLDNVFPLNLTFFAPIPFLERFLPRIMHSLQNPNISAADPEQIAERALHSPLPIKVTEILPRIREGGAFVKFSHEPEQDLKEVEMTVKQYLKQNPIKPWFNPVRRVKTFLVHGRPWVEDLHRMPNARVKVEFVPTAPGQQAEELSQETLYSLFRRYGKLADIMPQPTDSKDLPKFALLNFNTVRHAIRAKNCMHGFVLPANEGGGKAGTMLKLTYEQRRKAHYIWDWFVNHPRITVPILIALFTTVSVMIFDPWVALVVSQLMLANQLS
jgi:hypothetical protein